jgi:hypothetical protein
MSAMVYTEDILQNLKDAGCNKDMITTYMIYSDEDKKLKLLAQQRELLLNKLHEVQENLSCLDYLVYKINKKA